MEAWRGTCRPDLNAGTQGQFEGAWRRRDSASCPPPLQRGVFFLSKSHGGGHACGALLRRGGQRSSGTRSEWRLPRGLDLRHCLSRCVARRSRTVFAARTTGVGPDSGWSRSSSNKLILARPSPPCQPSCSQPPPPAGVTRRQFNSGRSGSLYSI